MAYVTTNPPALVTQRIAGGGRTYYYESADTIATVRAANYISNAYQLGMRAGDTVIVRDTATPTTSICSVISVVTNGAADISDGTVVSLTNT